LVDVRDDGGYSAGVTVPASFAAMPRWRAEGSHWLTALPHMIDIQCDRWGLRVVGSPAHGSNAIVLPVDRGGEPLVLRMTPPGPDVTELVRALRFWDGRGTVRLIVDDVDAGAMVLERLSAESLATSPVDAAMEVIGRMMRRLAVPAPADVRSTTALVAERAAALSRDWIELAGPFDRTLLAAATDAAERLSATDHDAPTAVNGDLHSAQMLRGVREPWLVVDPVLLRGDIAYDLARALWTRLDGIADAAGIVACFDIAVRASGVDRDRARDAVVFRTVDYWLWALVAGLTEDPDRCARLVRAFT
jgi:streptomycin 6-kinase